MSEVIKRYGKVLGSVVFGMAIIVIVIWTLAVKSGYISNPPLPDMIKTAMADPSTDADSDGLTDDWEDSNGFNKNYDNTDDVWTQNTYDAYGSLTVVKRYIVDSSVADHSASPVVEGLRCVSEVQYDYDQAGRVWRTRQLASPGGSTSDGNDKITLMVYDEAGKVEKTVAKDVGNSTINAIETGDIVTTNYFDDLGRTEYAIDAEDNAVYYAYTDAGQVEKIYRQVNGTPANQPLDYRTSFDTITFPGDDDREMMIVSENTYDDAGRVTITTDARGSYREMTYGSMGRVIKAIAKNSSDTAMQQVRKFYDNLGRVASDIVMAAPDETDPADETVDKVTDYSYFTSTGAHPGKLYSVTTYNNGASTPLATIYDYDEIGRQIKVTVPDNDIDDINESHTAYNAAGRALYRWAKEYNDDLSETVYTLSKYHYGQTGQVIEQRQMAVNPATTGLPSTYPSESENDLVTSFAYNGLGQLLEVIDPEENVTEHYYNWLGQKSKTVADADAGGLAQTTEFGYDRLGRQTSIVGYADNTDTNDDQTTAYAYDDMGRVTTITYPDSETIVYAYNELGQVAQRTDQRSIVTGYTYDAVGNLRTKEVTDDYDLDGTRDDRIKEAFTYDDLNRMETAKKEVDNNYDSQNEDFVHISTSTMSSYTSLGSATDINDKYFNDSTGKTSTYGYGQAGNLTQIVYPDSTQVDIAVTARGQIDTIDMDYTRIASYDYVGGRVARRVYDDTDSGSYDVTYKIEYDNYGRAKRHYTYKATTAPTVITDFNTYTYDDNSNITGFSLAHRGTGYDNSYTYDDLNRLTAVEYLGDDSDTESFTMDDLGNRQSALHRGDSAAKDYVIDTETNRYTAIGNQVGRWKLDETSGTTAADVTGDNDGTLNNFPANDSQWVTGKIGGALEFDGLNSSYDYVDLGTGLGPVAFGGANGASTVSAWVYVDDTTRYNVVTHHVGGFDYFSAGRTTYTSKLICMVWDSTEPGNDWPASTGTITGGVWTHIAFVFDAGTGARFYINGVLDDTENDSNWQLHSYGTTAYLGYGVSSTSYFDGKMDEVQAFDEALTDAQVYALYISKTGGIIDYDKAGNMLSDKDGYLYAYDYENRIIEISKGDGDSTPTQLATFEYDALGRRISKTDYVALGDPETLYYYNDRWQVLCEYDNDDDMDRLYVYGNYIDEVLYCRNIMTKGPNPPSTIWYMEHYYAHNHLFSVCALLDDTGTIAERYEYNAYGKLIIWNSTFTTTSTTSPYNNPYYFTGRRLDTLDSGDLEIMYYRNRYYNCETGRFLTSDPLDYIDGLNLYQYVLSRPILLIDCYGLYANTDKSKIRDSNYQIDQYFPNYDNCWEGTKSSDEMYELVGSADKGAKVAHYSVSASGSVEGKLTIGVSIMAKINMNINGNESVTVEASLGISASVSAKVSISSSHTESADIMGDLYKVKPFTATTLTIVAKTGDCCPLNNHAKDGCPHGFNKISTEGKTTCSITKDGFPQGEQLVFIDGMSYYWQKGQEDNKKSSKGEVFSEMRNNVQGNVLADLKSQLEQYL